MVLLTGGVKTGANTMAPAPSSTYYDPSKPGYLGGALTALGQFGGGVLSGIMAPTGSKPLQGNVTGTYAPPPTYSNTEYYPKPGTGVYAPATTNNTATINEIHKSLALPNFGWPGMETSFPDVPHIAPFDAPMPMAYGGPQQSGFTPPPQQAGPEGYRMPQQAPIQQPTGSGPRGQAPVMPQQPMMMPREAQQPGEGGTQARVNTRSGQLTGMMEGKPPLRRGQLASGGMDGKGSGFGGDPFAPLRGYSQSSINDRDLLKTAALQARKPAAPVLPASAKVGTNAAPKAGAKQQKADVGTGLVPPPPPEAAPVGSFAGVPGQYATPDYHSTTQAPVDDTRARTVAEKQSGDAAFSMDEQVNETLTQRNNALNRINSIYDLINSKDPEKLKQLQPTQEQQWQVRHDAMQLANSMYPIGPPPAMSQPHGQGGGVLGMLGRAGRRYGNNGVDPYFQQAQQFDIARMNAYTQQYGATIAARKDVMDKYVEQHMPNPYKQLGEQVKIAEKVFNESSERYTSLVKQQAELKQKVYNETFENEMKLTTEQFKQQSMTDRARDEQKSELQNIAARGDVGMQKIAARFQNEMSATRFKTELQAALMGVKGGQDRQTISAHADAKIKSMVSEYEKRMAMQQKTIENTQDLALKQRTMAQQNIDRQNRDQWLKLGKDVLGGLGRGLEIGAQFVKP